MDWIATFLSISFGCLRIGGLLISMPIFGTSPIPPGIKFFLAFGLSMAMLPFHSAVPPAVWARNDLLLIVGIRELFLGLIMGYGIRFIFLIVTMALEFAGLQMGFAMANIFDPANNTQISVLAQVGSVVVILFFFTTNLHHDVFLAVAKSYEIIPIGLPQWNFSFNMERLVSFIGNAFGIALRLSMPVMIAMFTIHFVIGVVSRTAPQMNLFFNVAFVVNVVTGIILVALLIPRLLPEVSSFSHSLAQKGYGLW